MLEDWKVKTNQKFLCTGNISLECNWNFFYSLEWKLLQLYDLPEIPKEGIYYRIFMK